MNEFLRKRIERKLDTLPDERIYQILDYIEFLESKYATKSEPAATALQRLADRNHLAARHVHRGRVDGLPFSEEQQQAFVRQMRADVAVDATVAIALGKAQDIVEVDEREPSAVHQPVHLRELQVREANR